VLLLVLCLVLWLVLWLLAAAPTVVAATTAAAGELSTDERARVLSLAANRAICSLPIVSRVIGRSSTAS
jgi:hypothetical protein